MNVSAHLLGPRCPAAPASAASLGSAASVCSLDSCSAVSLPDVVFPALFDLVQLPAASIWVVSRRPAMPPVFSIVMATAGTAGDDAAGPSPGEPVVEAQPA